MLCFRCSAQLRNNAGLYAKSRYIPRSTRTPMYKRYSYRITLSPKRNRLHRYIGRSSVRVRVIKSDRLHRLRPILNHVPASMVAGCHSWVSVVVMVEVRPANSNVQVLLPPEKVVGVGYTIITSGSITLRGT